MSLVSGHSSQCDPAEVCGCHWLVLGAQAQPWHHGRHTGLVASTVLALTGPQGGEPLLKGLFDTTHQYFRKQNFVF